MKADYKEIPQVYKPKNNSVLSKTVFALFSLYIVLSVVDIAISMGDISQLEGQQTALALENTDADAYLIEGYGDEFIARELSAARETFNVFMNVLYLGTIVAFIAWFYNAYANLRKLGVERLKYSEASAIYIWIIPFLNLFIPVRMVTEIIGQLQDRLSDYKPTYKKNSLKIGVAIWWTLFVLGNLGALVLIQLSNVSSIAQEIVMLKCVQYLDVLSVLEAIATIYVVYHINKLEGVLAKKLER